MKKIVALVLSLVMVLGLATTAFGATTYTVDSKNAADMSASVQDMEITVVPAKAAYVDAAGNMQHGWVMHYTYGARTFVPCTADTAGAQIWYYDGTKTVFDTVVLVDNVNYSATGVEFKDFGKACGQLNNEANPLDKYYTYVDGDGETVLVKGTLDTTYQLLVDGKLVGYTTADKALNAHKWVVEKNAKNEIVKATCSLCAQEATWVRNLASVPADADYEAAPGGGYLVYVAAVVTPDTDKVESAQTFDAGIAMYVGMSVMAAAGSAVVLKKKD